MGVKMFLVLNWSKTNLGVKWNASKKN